MEIFKIVFNTWQFNLGMFLFFGVISNQYFKLAVKNTSKENISTIIMQIVAGASILIFVPFFAFKFPSDPKIYLLLLLGSIFYAFGDRTQVTVRKNLEVSVYSILGQMVKVFLVLYGILVFKEEIIATKLIGGGLILLGNILIFYQKGKLKLNRYALLSFATSFFCATGMIIDVSISKNFNFPFYIMLTFIVPGFFIYLVRRFSFSELKTEFNSSRKKYYLITGVSWGFLAFFVIRALQLADVAFVAPLTAVIVLLNVMVASIFHKEKKDLFKKIIAALIIIGGAFLIVA